MQDYDPRSRVLPQMNFSPTGARLTEPIHIAPHLSPAERAAARFRVFGNAVVTGGTGDLGFAACRALLEHGLESLMIWDLQTPSSLERIEQLRQEFPSNRIGFSNVNVTNEEEVLEAANHAQSFLGSIQTLLTFAGVASCDFALNTTAEEWRRVMDINATGSFLCARAIASKMMLSDLGGSIVLIASISAHRVNFPQPQVAYNASKAAVLAMTKSFAAEWAADGIRVNSISPGYMDTILNEGSGLQLSRDVWTERNPMGRMGVPDELSGPLILLVSPAGRYITGTDIIVDGGQTLF